MQYSTHLACLCKTCNILHSLHVDEKHAMYYLVLPTWHVGAEHAIHYICHIDAKHALYYTLGVLMQNMQFTTYLACWWKNLKINETLGMLV